MKAKVVLSMLLTISAMGVLIAQTTTTSTAVNSKQSQASQPQSAKAWHLPKGWTADQAYKENCTRCHAEVPKLNSKQTKTIVRHMRVRANITHDEAEAILQYLNK